MTSDFVPKDYEVTTGGSTFFKLKSGENKFRILTDAVIGKVGWSESRPFRRPGADAVIDPSEVDVNDQGKPKIQDFMAFYIYDYADEKVKIAEFTQASIKKSIVEYAQDPDWSHPRSYDLTVTKNGEGLKTKYSVKPSPAKPLTKVAQAIVDEAEGSFDLNTALGLES